MNNITFDTIHIPGYIVFENNQYIHVHYPEMLTRYDSNFIEFKEIPTLSEFKDATSYLREYHLKKGQKHVKFYLPENEKPTEELIKYFKEMNIEYGYNELYTIEPSDFPKVVSHEDIEVRAIASDNLGIFLELQYQQDLEFGEAFAKQKVSMHKRNFENPCFQQVMAYYRGKPVGSLDVILADETAEIDGLHVLEAFQKKGIGSSLQKFVMEQFPEKTVILVADGEDTPRDMYRRQGYQYIGFKYEIQKISDN